MLVLLVALSGVVGVCVPVPVSAAVTIAPVGLPVCSRVVVLCDVHAPLIIKRINVPAAVLSAVWPFVKVLLLICVVPRRW